jgi:hypothetical protein
MNHPTDCQCKVCLFRRDRGVRVCPPADATVAPSERAFERAALAAREGGDPEVAEREFYAERAYLRSQGVRD